VLANVVTHKTIASIGLQGGVFKYVAIDRILEGEAGFTKNEPEQLAVQQAIEKAVHAMVIEGSEQGLWSFSDKGYQTSAIDQYRTQMFATAEQAQARAEAMKVATAKPAATPAAPTATATAETKPQEQKAANGKPVAPAGSAAPAAGQAPAKSAAAAPAPGSPPVKAFVTMLAPSKEKPARETKTPN